MRDEDKARHAPGQTAVRRACQGCGRVVDWCGGRADRCWACVQLRHRRMGEIRALARSRSVARKQSRGGEPGRFKVRSTVTGGGHVTWGSCETREEAVFEAGWILANVPEASRVAIDEVTRYEIDRDGLAGGDCFSPALAASAAASVREARGRLAA